MGHVVALRPVDGGHGVILGWSFLLVDRWLGGVFRRGRSRFLISWLWGVVGGLRPVVGWGRLVIRLVDYRPS